MDDVAAAAHVSKQTVYKHFADKERLFIEIVTETIDEISDPVHQAVLDLVVSGDIEADLGTSRADCSRASCSRGFCSCAGS